MDFPSQKQDSAQGESSVADAPKHGSHPRVPLTFFDPASMHELERTMTARSTRSHHRTQRDTLHPPPLPQPKKADKRKSAISIAMESGSGGDDDFNFEQTLKDLVRRYVIHHYFTPGSHFSQTGRRIHQGP